jgi:hypothetical protein
MSSNLQVVHPLAGTSLQQTEAQIMFDQLPAELRLRIFTHMNVRDLHNTQLVSKSWHEFFVSNESSIYRHAATIHGFSQSSDASLAEVKSASPQGSMMRVDGWKDLSKPDVPYFDLASFV